EIGVNESRVSQLHARAIRRLREALGDMGPQEVAEVQQALVAFASRKPMAKAPLRPAVVPAAAPGVVLPYKVTTPKTSRPAMPIAPVPSTTPSRVAVAR